MYIGLNNFKNVVYGIILSPISELHARVCPAHRLRALYPQTMQESNKLSFLLLSDLDLGTTLI